METLVIKTPSALEGIGFDKLGYIKIPIHKNRGTDLSTLTFKFGFIGFEGTDKIFIQGGTFVDRNTNEIAVAPGNSVIELVVGKIKVDTAYLYLPNRKMSSVEFPFLNSEVDNNYMADFRIADFPTTLIQFIADKPQYYSFTIVDSLNNLKKFKILTTFKFQIATDKWFTKSPILKLNEALDLPLLTHFSLYSMGNGFEFDSIAIKGSPLLGYFYVNQYSEAKVNTQHIKALALNYFLLINTPMTATRVAITGSFSDFSHVKNQLTIPRPDFSLPVGTAIWTDTISTINVLSSNMTGLDGDKFLSDFKGSISTNKTRSLALPRRTVASDAVVSALQDLGCTIVTTVV